MTDAAFITDPLPIERSYLDHNGHVNMAYHLVLVDQALDLAFAAFGVDAAYVQDLGLSTFAGEMHVRYLNEINFGDVMRGRVVFIEADAKRVRWAVELRRESDEAVTTTVEGVTLSVSLATRRVAPFAHAVRPAIAAMIESHRSEAAKLDWLGRRVGMQR
ncbi:thioesterase family protein [Methylopila sp. 73B]|uniref:acyl-CoA thioesterase n=1 Tax=Methylopila sp. 73B TaxID=1120792 RepID=UPI00036A1207|nr:thioesterase family protein [Methylopila sp. 73B]